MCSTSHPIDPVFTAELLAFEGVARNSMDAVACRDFLLEAISAISIAGVGLSRIAEELVLWSTSEFGFILLSDAYSFTSSIMPQKRNPDVSELSRARVSSIIGGLVSALSICKNLPLSYNSDLQEATFHLWNATATIKAVIPVLRGALSTMTVNEDAMERAANEGFLWATDLADLLVSEHGVPFRVAHSIVAEVASGWEGDMDPGKTSESIARASRKHGRTLDLDTKDISRLMNARKSVKRRSACGGPAPAVSAKLVKKSHVEMQKTLKWAGDQRKRIESARDKAKALQDGLAD
jgi:argininosuccinate lyase